MAFGTVGPTRLLPSEVPDPGPLRYGIFNVAPPQTLLPAIPQDDDRAAHAFAAGMFYDAKGCGTAHPYASVCPPSGGAVKSFDNNSAERQVMPFVVYASIVCGATGGNTVAYLTDKTGDRLYSSEQFAVEAAFWSGGFGNTPFIIDNTTSVNVGGAGTYANVVDAVAALEAYAYGTVPYGFDGVLHATPAVASYAAQAGLIDSANVFSAVWGVGANSRELRTPLGSKWSFGGGYAGTGPGVAGAGAAPGAGNTYIWMTGNVALWRADVWSPPDPYQVMDRTSNQYKLLAEREWLATYDCFNITAKVAIPKVAV
jgi:hypothetical protein